jgi:uncharacterized protein
MIPAQSRHELVERLIVEISRWVASEPTLRGMALVGSYARGTARIDSDVDLILLTAKVEQGGSTEWLGEVDWQSLGVSPEASRFVRYGVMSSHHVRLDNGLEVEFGFAPVTWASERPVDEGTRRVVSDGCRVVYDPDGLLADVCAEVAKARHSRGKSTEGRR